ncbi:MAG TPA: O-antigen ligase family protein [Candidatus Limnocylindria bacterium]|nr:O-antigen ligase family protein [Candidatus Limnocylindria bacterium]
MQPFFPVDLTVTLAIPTAAVGALWLLLNRDRLGRRQLIVLAMWFALAALVAAGILWAPDPTSAVRSAAYFIVLGTTPLLAAFAVAADETRTRQFLLVFLASGLVYIGIAMIALLTGELGGGLVMGANRISVARALLFVPLIAIPLLVWHRLGPREWILVALASLGIFLAFATSSRAPILFFIVVGSALTLGALARSRHRTRALGRAGAVVLGTVVVFVAFAGALPERSPARFGLLLDVAAEVMDEPAPTDGGEGVEEPPPEGEDGPTGGESVARRADLLRMAWLLFLAHPVAGAGTAGYEAAAGYEYPHNLVLHLASEFGLAGLAWLGALVVLTLLTWRPNSTVSVALGALLAFLVLNAMVSNGIYENRMLWGVWLVLLAGPLEVLPAKAGSEARVRQLAR